MLKTNCRQLDWMISRGETVGMMHGGTFTMPSRAAEDIRRWLNQQPTTRHDGANTITYALHIDGWSLIVKYGAKKSTQNRITVWIEREEPENDPDQAEFVNWWVE